MERSACKFLLWFFSLPFLFCYNLKNWSKQQVVCIINLNNIYIYPVVKYHPCTFFFPLSPFWEFNSEVSVRAKLLGAFFIFFVPLNLRRGQLKKLNVNTAQVNCVLINKDFINPNKRCNHSVA